MLERWNENSLKARCITSNSASHRIVPARTSVTAPTAALKGLIVRTKHAEQVLAAARCLM